MINCLVKDKRQRLVIYRKALEFMLSDHQSPHLLGLCLLLTHLSKGTWYFIRTSEHFPEFGKHHTGMHPIKYIRLYYKDKKLWRIKVLERSIKLCEQSIEATKRKESSDDVFVMSDFADRNRKPSKSCNHETT